MLVIKFAKHTCNSIRHRRSAFDSSHLENSIFIQRILSQDRMWFKLAFGIVLVCQTSLFGPYASFPPCDVSHVKLNISLDIDHTLPFKLFASVKHCYLTNVRNTLLIRCVSRQVAHLARHRFHTASQNSFRLGNIAIWPVCNTFSLNQRVCQGKPDISLELRAVLFSLLFGIVLVRKRLLHSTCVEESPRHLARKKKVTSRAKDLGRL